MVLHFNPLSKHLVYIYNINANPKSTFSLSKTSLDVEAKAEEINGVSDNDDRVEEPKPSWKFAIDQELMTYYK